MKFGAPVSVAMLDTDVDLVIYCCISVAVGSRAMKRRQSWVGHQCEECGKQFDSSRHDARFCSATCRSRAHRKIDAKDKAIARAKAAIDDLMKYCVSPSAADCMAEVFGWLINPDDKREFVYQIREVVRVEEQ